MRRSVGTKTWIIAVINLIVGRELKPNAQFGAMLTEGDRVCELEQAPEFTRGSTTRALCRECAARRT